nr:hypothetical protein [Ornithobacterium rhinotracheale]
MTIHEILRLVGTYRTNALCLFKEGSFRKCYNEHAMCFTNNIKPMKVHTRFYKNANCYVHSMGFPETALEGYLEKLKTAYTTMQIESLSPTCLILKELKWKDQLDYLSWSEQKIQKEEKLKAIEETNEMPKYTEDRLVKMIEDFRIESATPLDAFNFVQKLKKVIV